LTARRGRVTAEKTPLFGAGAMPENPAGMSQTTLLGLILSLNSTAQSCKIKGRSQATLGRRHPGRWLDPVVERLSNDSQRFSSGDIVADLPRV
jgi:hypothetical protein